MKILHTSDWHLGRMLYGKKRYDEFAAFLNWLVQTIADEQITILIVAGDIFDTGTPSNRAQELYYHFLRDVGKTGCEHIIIVAGNHDSPSFLNAPRELLRALNIHIVGNASSDLTDQLLILKNRQQHTQAIIAAVPYLRDRDIRLAEAGETIQDKELKLLQGIQNHYAALGQLAQTHCAADEAIPLIATGHLFASGAHTTEGDGVRDLYVGSLGHVPISSIPACFDYVALGHLHIPQTIGGLESRRYSGSPLPMGFGEARQTKSVCVVEFEGKTPHISLLTIPRFQELALIRGDLPAIQQQIHHLRDSGKTVWLEVVYEGETLVGNLREQVEAMVENTLLVILRIKNTRLSERVLQPLQLGESLDDLDEFQVFERCLQAHAIPDGQWADLKLMYQEMVLAVRTVV